MTAPDVHRAIAALVDAQSASRRRLSRLHTVAASLPRIVDESAVDSAVNTLPLALEVLDGELQAHEAEVARLAAAAAALHSGEAIGASASASEAATAAIMARHSSLVARAAEWDARLSSVMESAQVLLAAARTLDSNAATSVTQMQHSGRAVETVAAVTRAERAELAMGSAIVSPRAAVRGSHGSESIITPPRHRHVHASGPNNDTYLLPHHNQQLLQQSPASAAVRALQRSMETREALLQDNPARRDTSDVPRFAESSAAPYESRSVYTMLSPLKAKAHARRELVGGEIVAASVPRSEQAEALQFSGPASVASDGFARFRAELQRELAVESTLGAPRGYESARGNAVTDERTFHSKASHTANSSDEQRRQRTSDGRPDGFASGSDGSISRASSDGDDDGGNPHLLVSAHSAGILEMLQPVESEGTVMLPQARREKPRGAVGAYADRRGSEIESQSGFLREPMQFETQGIELASLRDWIDTSITRHALAAHGWTEAHDDDGTGEIDREAEDRARRAPPDGGSVSPLRPAISPAHRGSGRWRHTHSAVESTLASWQQRTIAVGSSDGHRPNGDVLPDITLTPVRQRDSHRGSNRSSERQAQQSPRTGTPSLLLEVSASPIAAGNGPSSVVAQRYGYDNAPRETRELAARFDRHDPRASKSAEPANTSASDPRRHTTDAEPLRSPGDGGFEYDAVSPPTMSTAAQHTLRTSSTEAEVGGRMGIQSARDNVLRPAREHESPETWTLARLADMPW